MGRYMVDTRPERKGDIYAWSRHLAESQPWMKEIWGEFRDGGFVNDEVLTPKIPEPPPQDAPQSLEKKTRDELLQMAKHYNIKIWNSIGYDKLLERVKRALEKDDNSGRPEERITGVPGSE